MHNQFLAGSLIGAVRDALNSFSGEKALQIEGLLKSVSTFEVSGVINLKADNGMYQSHLAVLHNIITRGIPTLASTILEEKIAEAFNRTELQVDEVLGEFSFPFSGSPSKFELIFDTLHLIDPRLNLDKNNYNDKLLESNFERDFFYNQLSGENEFLKQLFLPQRSFSSLIHPRRANGFINQRVDFAVETPYFNNYKLQNQYNDTIETQKRKGFIVEIDGPIHRYTTLKDNNQDVEAKEAWWEPLRIRSGNEKEDIREALNSLNEDPYLTKCKELYRRTLKGEWLDIIQLVLVPFAIARIQMVIIEYLLGNPKLLTKKKLNIAILEQDVPCGNLAVYDLNEYVGQLTNLAQDSLEFPLITTEVYCTPEFYNSSLHKIEGQGSIKDLRDFSANNNKFDLVLDISMLRRAQIEKLPHIDNCIFIRSSHYQEADTRRTVYTAKSIQYHALTKKLPNENFETVPEKVKHLEFFLGTLFRKQSFLDGQLPILNRALQNQSVIGLLPTGGGKSLTYQLASLLQPGLTLVVDPIKSLMQDQYDNLIEAGIDSTIFINSTLSTQERKINTARFEVGEFMFCFVSPERLIIQEFRDALEGLEKSMIYFSYCVIDEVHCVSEWGHDFRTAYLSLGKNAVDYCKAAEGNPVPIFGLTATASFDVLADVERELSYRDNIGLDAIVRRENTIRDEIQYRILEVNEDFQVKKPIKIDGFVFNEIGPLFIEEYNNYKNQKEKKDVDYWKVKEYLGTKKAETINSLIREIPSDLKTRYNKKELTEILEQTFDKFLEEKDIDEFIQKNNLQGASREKLKRTFIEEQIKIVEFRNLNTEDFFNDSCDHAGIIFCPHRGSDFGVTDRFKWKKYKKNEFDDSDRIIHRKGDYVKDENENKIPVPPSERKGITDRLTHDKLKIGTFIGSGEDNEKDQRIIQESSFQNQEDFIRNKLNLMVATKAFGMGINKRNIRFTIHLNMPNSLEGFIQEGGRAGRDRKMALNYILVNNQKFSSWNDSSLKRLQILNKKEKIYNESEINHIKTILEPIKNKFFYKEDFEKLVETVCKDKGIPHYNAIVKSTNHIHFDQDILQYFHNRSFKGKDKEKAILFELRDRITYPNVPRMKILEEYLKEELLLDELSLNISKNRWVHFNVGFPNSFGFIDLETGQYKAIKVAEYTIAKSNELLESAIGYIQREFHGPYNLEDKAMWLQEVQILPPESGIEHWILDDRIPIGTKKEEGFKIHFENLYTDFNEYKKRLRSFWQRVFNDLDENYNINNIDSCLPEEEDLELYLNNIEDEFGEEVIRALDSENRLDALKLRYFCKRKKEDTDKAIYRLQSMRLIEDYTIDYNARMYHLEVIKKPLNSYVDSLYEFIKRYYSEVKARREVEKIDQSDPKFTIRNCINFLTDFIYREIEKKRKAAIDDMQAACKEGLNENNLAFKEFVYLYFNSKFARRIFFVNGEDYSLLSEENTDDGNVQSFEVVWKFIRAVNGEVDGSQVDNLKHLRGACLRILRSNPDNATLNLLKAYSLFILASKNESLFKEASESYFKGFAGFREFYTDQSTNEFNDQIEKYKKYVLENTEDKKVKEVIERLTRYLYIQLAANKFHNFKIKFLESYG